jgi:hypothetical protein
MRQFRNYADERNSGFCVHCGSTADETRDHAPSKAFLDEPLPENLPVTFACRRCNNGFSLDEQYLAALLECVVCGHADADKVERPKVAATLRGDPALSLMLARARREEEGRVVWDVDEGRVRNVMLKLARGHVAFELNQPRREEPTDYWVKPLALMSPGERQEFEEGGDDGMFGAWPEVGSIAMQRLLVVEGEPFVEDTWLVVQDGRYRYRVDEEDGAKVRIVIREYLAGYVAWD